MRKILSLITALVLCTTMWGAEVIPAGEYAGTWYRHSISQLDGRATKATSVVVSAEESGKQTITFKGFKCGYQGDVAVDIPITVTTSNGSCTIANDVEVGHTNATYGKMYIRTYANYTSSVDPSSMIITLCTRYYYYDTDGKTEKNYGTEYEYIQLNPAEWTDWVAFPAAEKNAATWTFSASNAFKSLIDESCDVTLMSRTAKENANHRQYKVCGFQMKAGSGKKVDLVFDENPSTKNITFGYAGLGFYETTAKQARAKMETGSFDAEKGVFTLNVKYVYANAWKAAVAETLAIHKEEPVEKKALYLKAGSVDYMKDNAVVYAYCWGGADEDEWSKFEYVEKETTAVTSIAEDRTGMKIVRFASGTTTPSWQGTIWNQTGDISVSSDFPEKVDMIELSAWDGATAATWSKYGAAVEKPKHDYTITVYLPAFCDDIAAYADSIRVMGGFDDWSNGIYMQKIVDEDFNDCWYAEIKDVEEGTEFKLRFGTDADWKVQVQLNGANMANEAFGETTDIVLHYDGEGYGFAACAAPVARKEFVFVAGEVADSDPTMFAITWGKDGSSETVKMEKGEALYAADILATVDSVVLVRCATGATEIIWDGEGKNIWNQTANYALCDTMYFGEWTEEGLFTLTCEAPKPVETKYYAKNNWDGATEWTWLEMSATDKENFYMLDSVVFGGTGVNINDKEDDTDALWFAADAITVLDGLDGLPGPIPPEPRKRDTIPYAPAHSGIVLEAPQLLAGDTIKLFFNAADSTLKAFIVGRPEQPQPVEVKYYITGNAALCGEKAWDAQAIEMIDSTHTFEAMAAGEYEMKITNGAWDPEGQSWGSAALSEECSAGVDDKGGNIHFIVETPNNVVVSIANGKVTVTGTFKESSVTAGIKVNVTVPEGTPACFFYGEMSGNSFVEMTKVDETHYTIDFPKATTIGWGYLFVWENGNWNTKNAEGDFTTEPVEGVINVEVKAWVTAPGTEYKYTTYTEWQVKYGPAWEWVNMTKQEDGTFTVEAVWGNTGINIASGENPIKQDWYPLDDAALTVAEDVAEGDNVVISLTVVNDNTVALNVAKKVTTNISNVKGQAGQRYNILGQPVNETYRGIVIMNGQTFLQK